MSLARRFLLIGLLVAIGCLQVAQRNAVFLKGYALGRQTEQLHLQETELSWLQARVIALKSPVRLAQDVAKLTGRTSKAPSETKRTLRVASTDKTRQ